MSFYIFFILWNIWVLLIYGVILGGVLWHSPLVFLSLFPEYVEMILLDYVSDPLKYHVYCSRYFCFDVPLTILFSDVFGVPSLVGPSSWISLSGIFSNNPPNYAYVSNAITFLIMLHYTFTGTFFEGFSCIGVLYFGPRKNVLRICFVPLVLICRMNTSKCG